MLLKGKKNKKKKDDVYIEWHPIAVQGNRVKREDLLFPKQ